MWTNIIILTLATIQRAIEFYVAYRNTRKLIGRGGFAVGPNLQPLMIALQGLWLAGLWYWAFRLEVSWPWLFAYLALEAARGWIVAALGSRWTTRIVVIPGNGFEDERPFNTFREPNYAIIAMEMFILPMVFGLWWYGALFAVLYAGLVYWRVTAENRALKPLREAPQFPEE